MRPEEMTFHLDSLQYPRSLLAVGKIVNFLARLVINDDGEPVWLVNSMSDDDCLAAIPDHQQSDIEKLICDAKDSLKQQRTRTMSSSESQGISMIDDEGNVDQNEVTLSSEGECSNSAAQLSWNTGMLHKSIFPH